MRIKNKLVALGCIAATAGALVCGMACNEHEIEPFSQSLIAGKKQLTGAGNARAVDIVFVIDNSLSMADEQRDIDSNFGKFINKLVDAGADFRIGVVTTSDKLINSNSAQFSTNKAFGKDNPFWANASIGEAEKAEIKDRCSEYFENHDWIASNDIESYLRDGETSSEYVRTLFRCAAMAGIDGDAIERGLSTMWKSLSTYLGDSVKDENHFKRPGSILSVVFVTDENDCSDSYFNGSEAVLADGETPAVGNVIDGNNTKQCENFRNIEDSCTIANRDMVAFSADKGSSLVLAGGQAVTYNDETRLLRDWCVTGDETARKALCKCRLDYMKHLEDETAEDCPAGANINYGGKTYEEVAKKCDPNDYSIVAGTKQLVPRSYYYEKIINYVIDSNREEYQKGRADLANLTPGDFKKAVRDLAKADVIIASIMNRDEGQRYDGAFPENWCGSAGNQSYRYQLFGEMFDNDPIYAPICCKEEFKTADKDDNLVCSADMSGMNANFGPVLGAIGQRIGEAVNTICTESAPLTCKIEDCNEPEGDGYSSTKPRSNPGPACACNRGCNGDVTYLANSDRQYNLCNEFKVGIGTVPEVAKGADLSVDSYKALEEGVDYKVEYESNYCYTRTGSPIQVNMVKTTPGTTLVIEYPKKVVGQD